MSRKKISIILTIAVLVLIILTTGWKLKWSEDTTDSSEEISISAVEAVPGAVSIRVEGPSIIEPFQTRNIRSGIEGVITSSAEEGDSIQEGEILISLNGNDMKIAVEQAKINLSKAELNRDRNISNLQNAEKNLTDTIQLFNGGAVSGEQVSIAELAVDTALFNLNSSNLDVSQAALVLDIAKDNLDNIYIRAPFSGVVLSSFASPGDMVSKGTTLLSFVDLSRVRLKAEVDEFDISKVQIGQKVTITSDSLGDEKLGSKVEKISTGAEVINNISIFTVSTILNNIGGKLKPGMSADLSILISADKGLLVPSKAVTSVRTRSYVKVFINEEIETRKVVVGANDGRNIVILEGLEEGELVIIPTAPGFQLTTTDSSSPGTSVIPVRIPGSK